MAPGVGGCDGSSVAGVWRAAMVWQANRSGSGTVPGWVVFIDLGPLNGAARWPRLKWVLPSLPGWRDGVGIDGRALWPDDREAAGGLVAGVGGARYQPTY